MSFRCWQAWEGLIIKNITPFIRERFVEYNNGITQVAEEHAKRPQELLDQFIDNIYEWGETTREAEGQLILARWAQFPAAYKAYTAAYVQLLSKSVSTPGKTGIPVEVKVGSPITVLYQIFQCVADNVNTNGAGDGWKPRYEDVERGVEIGLREGLHRDKIGEAYLTEMGKKNVYGQPKADVRAVAEAAADAAAAAAKVAAIQHEEETRLPPEDDYLGVEDIAF